jgi:opacity protein-like surface antigen
MARVTRRVLLGLLLVWASSVTPASAEWFGDLYLGGALTGTGTQNIDSAVAKFRNVRFDTSLAVGGRGGYWFEDFDYLGLAFDVVHFRPDVGAQTLQTDQGSRLPLAKLDLEVFGLSIDLMLRYPLWRDEQFPKGRLQPYVLVGPLVGITTARDTTNFGPPNGQSHTSSPAGFNVGVGLLWALQRHVGLFAEYRYLAFHPRFQFDQAGKVDLHINTQLLLGGVSVRF